MTGTIAKGASKNLTNVEITYSIKIIYTNAHSVHLRSIVNILLPAKRRQSIIPPTQLKRPRAYIAKGFACILCSGQILWNYET